MLLAELDTALREHDGPQIVCAQAGEVNTGAFDPLDEIVGLCRTHGAWCHVDGAFGLWAAIDPSRRHLLDYIPPTTATCPGASSPRPSSRAAPAANDDVQILNDVVLNQVLVRFAASDAITDRVSERVHHDGVCWAGGSRWHGGTVCGSPSAAGRRRPRTPIAPRTPSSPRCARCWRSPYDSVSVLTPVSAGVGVRGATAS